MKSRDWRATLFITVASAGLVVQHPARLAAQPSPGGKAPAAAHGNPAHGARADSARIREAMSAAPEHIAAHATIVDWPEHEGAPMKTLRQGTNGWTCMPSTPHPSGALGLDPMCLDQQWQTWAAAWKARQPPTVTQVGIAYMLKGDRGASNTDPFATSATAANHWVHSGPHLMVLVPDRTMLGGLSTDPAGGGPWVMWKGTPYEHVMVPTR